MIVPLRRAVVADKAGRAGVTGHINRGTVTGQNTVALIAVVLLAVCAGRCKVPKHLAEHGGRIGRAAATAGALLKVKPLIGYKDAGLIADGIAQGRKKALVKVRDLFFRYLEREQIDLDRFRLATGFGLDRAEHEAFAQTIYNGLLERGYDRPEVKRPYQIGVTIGVHTGPTPLGWD